MKTIFPTVLALALALPGVRGEEESPSLPEALAKHERGSEKLAGEQDELSADVQELIEQQANEEVIQLLEQVEEMMAEVTGALDEAETGGTTIAAETHIIELIFDAAKKKQQSSGSSSEQSQESMGAMLEMMQRMMGQEPNGQQPQGQQEGKPGEQSGGNNSGASDAPSGPQAGQSGGASEERRVPKSAGVAGAELPEEFRKAIDAYNQPAQE